MDNHIDPAVTAILKQLEDMKDDVIRVGRTSADNDKSRAQVIKALRIELAESKKYNVTIYQNYMQAERACETSTVSMILSWIFFGAAYVIWVLL